MNPDDEMNPEDEARYAICAKCLSKPGLPGASRCLGEMETRKARGLKWRNPYHVEGHPGLDQPYGPEDICDGCEWAGEHRLRKFVGRL